jgi:hypothetical protein
LALVDDSAQWGRTCAVSTFYYDESLCRLNDTLVACAANLTALPVGDWHESFGVCWGLQITDVHNIASLLHFLLGKSRMGLEEQ